MEATNTLARPVQSGRGWIWLGIGLALAGIGAYVLQLAAGRLFMPWYMPALATIAVGLAALALWRARSIWRVIALVLLLLLAGGEWAMMLSMKVPAYTGPVAVGKPLPVFKTLRADGAAFANANLVNDKNTVLVFFRGHW